MPVMAGKAATQQQAPRHAAVEAVSCGKTGSLLGQGVLARFKSWSPPQQARWQDGHGQPGDGGYDALIGGVVVHACFCCGEAGTPSGS